MTSNPPAALSASIDWSAVRAARARGETVLPWVQSQLGGPDIETVARVAAELSMRGWNSEALWQSTPAWELWPMETAQSTGALLLRESPDHLHAVVDDPLDEATLARLRHAAGDHALSLGIAWPADLTALIAHHAGQQRATARLESPAARVAAEREDGLALTDLGEQEHPAVRLVNATLLDALRAGASDVHLESSPTGLNVKLRLDGMLSHLTAVHDGELAEQAISRLKVLAELDIGERRVPQDGSFRARWMGRAVDLRLSVIPGIHGEDAVIRVLDKQGMTGSREPLRLAGLGFDDATLDTLRHTARSAHGMVLVTGPTGSGKTTTLYALLGDTRSGHEKIITIEDPVEYQLDGVLQIAVNERKGLTFARGLRSVLRHDPDTIMVGEIRDRETAEIAVQSALTGHLVLTTVHANSVFDVFDRFTHMGLDPHALASSLNGVWAQRLLRRVCPHCRQPHEPDPELWAALTNEAVPPGAHLARGRGCAACRGTGYLGRQAIAEVLALDDELREAVVQRAPVRRLKALARERGVRSLRDAAMALVAQGQTTLEEVRRVTVAS